MIRIFVGNLNWSTTRQDLLTMFSPFGDVESIDVVTNGSNGQPRGFAFIEMPRTRAHMAIAQLHGAKLRGRCINVREAPPEMAAQKRSAASD